MPAGLGRNLIPCASRGFTDRVRTYLDFLSRYALSKAAQMNRPWFEMHLCWGYRVCEGHVHETGIL